MSDAENILSPPRGMRDFYPEDMVLRNRLFEVWGQAARQFGFQQYDACVVENLALLRRKAGEEIVDQIYAFNDKSGRELALRPEMTPTLARMVAARAGAAAFPLKWFALAQCFRYERMSKGRKREHFQWNLDIVGEESVSAEVEVIATALHALSLLGLNNSHVRVCYSSRALLGELLASMGIAPQHHAATFLALDKRGKIDDPAIEALLQAEGLDAATIASVFGLLAISSIEDALSRLPAGSETATRLRTFVERLATYGIQDAVEFDISVIRGLSYYTGIVFEAFDINRKFRAIFGGGRYDNLLNDIGGTPATAVGLGFGDVVVAELLMDLGLAGALSQPAGTAVGFMEEAQRKAAMTLASTLRKSGQAVDLALKPEKPKHFFSRAGKSFREAVYIGPDDLAKGTARVKDLSDRSEREIPLV